MPLTDQQHDIRNVKIKQTLEKSNSNVDGLSSPEVKKRQEKYGLNEISEVHQNPILKFLGYFWGPIPIMIEVWMEASNNCMGICVDCFHFNRFHKIIYLSISQY